MQPITECGAVTVLISTVLFIFIFYEEPELSYLLFIIYGNNNNIMMG
jgi:hypothetical protein